MGHGVAAWFTPGWSIYEHRQAPHVPHDQMAGIQAEVKQDIANGEDPKPKVLAVCKPQCTFYWDKLKRCEAALEGIIKINPTKTCLYPMRDYATCVEACVQPVIHNELVGADHGLTKAHSDEIKRRTENYHNLKAQAAAKAQ